MSRRVVVAAYAKVNLTLEVLGKREDGYHELASVFATIDLRDNVRVAASHRLDVRVSPPIPASAHDELATRSVAALASASGRAAVAHIRIAKRIPLASGLGGGSSDAGATLRGLARLWRLDGIDLCRVGAQVGSDVPFFASGAGFALVRGRGELVESLPPPAARLWIVLVLVAARLDTPSVFAALPERRSDGSRSRAIAERLRNGTTTVEALRDGLVNDLTETAERIAPAIAKTRNLAAILGIDLAMSGSGPSLFTLAKDRAHALQMARVLRRAGLKARLCALGVAPRSTSDRGLSPYG